MTKFKFETWHLIVAIALVFLVGKSGFLGALISIPVDVPPMDQTICSQVNGSWNTQQFSAYCPPDTFCTMEVLSAHHCTQEGVKIYEGSRFRATHVLNALPMTSSDCTSDGGTWANDSGTFYCWCWNNTAKVNPSETFCPRKRFTVEVCEDLPIAPAEPNATHMYVEGTDADGCPTWTLQPLSPEQAAAQAEVEEDTTESPSVQLGGGGLIGVQCDAGEVYSDVQKKCVSLPPAQAPVVKEKTTIEKLSDNLPLISLGAGFLLLGYFVYRRFR